MSTDMTWQVSSNSSAETEAIGVQLGQRLRGGELIELTSDLGGGKTTFVRGLARGMGSSDVVASPSFTIGREYTTGHLTMHHLDFYRLNEPGVVANEVAEFLQDPKAVVVIEWAGLVEGILPTERVRMAIAMTDNDARQFTIQYPEKFAYLISEAS